MSTRTARVWPVVYVLFASVAAGCGSDGTAPPPSPAAPDNPSNTVVKVDPSSVTLAIGHTQQLLASVPQGPIGPGVLWSTSDATIAEVTSTGLVTAKSPGVAVISARAKGGVGSASVTVK